MQMETLLSRLAVGSAPRTPRALAQWGYCTKPLLVLEQGRSR